MTKYKNEQASVAQSKEINKLADQIVKPMITEMNENRLSADDSGVEVFNSIWIVKPHYHSVQVKTDKD